jgi:hypothetical protein
MINLVCINKDYCISSGNSLCNISILHLKFGDCCGILCASVPSDLPRKHIVQFGAPLAHSEALVGNVSSGVRHTQCCSFLSHQEITLTYDTAPSAIHHWTVSTCEWPDCKTHIAAVCMAGTLLGATRHSQESWCLFQKHSFCLQYLHLFGHFRGFWNAWRNCVGSCPLLLSFKFAS